MRRLPGTLFCAALACVAARAQAPSAALAVAEQYVTEALARNPTLQSQALEVDAARARLAEVSSALHPRVDLTARYTRADGGRTIDVPLGDLLNPVYATLNEQRVGQGLPPTFPTLANESIPLLRDREQETKLRITQPLYHPELTRATSAARSSARSSRAALAAQRRDLRVAVLTAYHEYLQTEAVVEVLASAAVVTAEALRTTRVLADADKVTVDRVLRAEADDLLVAQQRSEAERDRDLARARFNSLLDRPLHVSIDRPGDGELRTAAAQLLALSVEGALNVSRREELAALEHAVTAARAAEDARRVTRRPTLALVADGGLQGRNYRTGQEGTFVQGSLVAEFSVWDGRRRRAQVEGAAITRRKVELQLAATRTLLELEGRAAVADFRAAKAAHHAAQARAEAAARAFDLVAARTREGLVAQLSFIDARNERTRAELNAVVARSRLFIAAARLERAEASTPAP